MGMEFHKKKNFKEAESIYQQILQAWPNHGDVLHLLGVVYQQSGRSEEGIRSIQKAIAVDDKKAVYHNNLGLIYLETNSLDLAVSSFAKAIELKGDYPDPYNNLGDAYYRSNQLPKSIASYQKAISLRPKYAKAHNGLGEALAKFGNIEDAISCFRNALKCDRNFFKALINLSYLLEMTNQLADAEKFVDQALLVDSRHPSGCRIKAALLRRRKEYDEALELLSEVKIPTDSPVVASAIHIEFARLYDQQGDVDKAYNHYSQANQLHKQCGAVQGVNRERFSQRVERCSQVFSKEWVDSWTKVEGLAWQQSPVFLVGFPRSGTTLLDQVLDSHPQVQVMEEQPLIRQLINTLPSYPEALQSFNDQQVVALGQEYFRLAQEKMLLKDGALLIDKLPFNLIHLGFISRIFPNAKIILALRHPFDVCLSNFMQLYAPNHAMAHFDTLANGAEIYDKIMRLWQQYGDIFAFDYHAIKYEQVVSDFDGEIKGLLDFLELPWDDAVRSFAEHARQRGMINTPSYHQVSQELFSSAVYRWQRYQPYLQTVAPLLDSHAKSFGYTTSLD